MAFCFLCLFYLEALETNRFELLRSKVASDSCHFHHFPILCLFAELHLCLVMQTFKLQLNGIHATELKVATRADCRNSVLEYEVRNF